MRGEEVDEMLRQARGAPSGWAHSGEGRQVLAEITQTEPAASGHPASGHRGRRGRRSGAYLSAAAAVAAALVLATVLSTVSQSRSVTAAPAQAQVQAMDVYHPGDVEFLKRFAYGGGTAMEAEYYKSVAQMAGKASVVLTGRVQDVKPTRTITGETKTDVVKLIGVVVSPTEVLRGTLPPRFRDAVTVEFLSSGDTARSVQKLKRALPRGEAIWVLRAKSGNPDKLPENTRRKLTVKRLAFLEEEKSYYRLVSSQGLFLQGQSRVVNPIVERVKGERGVVQEAESHDKLSHLAAKMRSPR